MAFVVKYMKIIRNHWKKSTFAAVALTYGFNYTDNYLITQELMRNYCRKAEKYGHEPLPVNAEPKTVTVILNPNANKRKATAEFEKYCAPILHLAGIKVEIVKTESEGHAKTLVESVNGTDAIVVAGGDGTLSEVVTGLLRRTEENTDMLVPLGVLPLGRSNTVATNLFPGGHNIKHVSSLVDAAFAIVEAFTKSVDVMRIEVSSTEEDKEVKPIYAVSGLKWGAYRDAEVKKDKYWYFGSLRNYATYLFNGFRNNLTWNCQAQIYYSLPCQGCSNCLVPKNKPAKNFFSRFINESSSKTPVPVDNPECRLVYEKEVCTTDLVLQTTNICSNKSDGTGNVPRLFLNIGPKMITYPDFVKEGWNSENGKERNFEEAIEAREVVIKPLTNSSEKSELWFSIDNENFEVKPIKVTLLPKCLKMFCKNETA